MSRLAIWGTVLLVCALITGRSVFMSVEAGRKKETMGRVHSVVHRLNELRDRDGRWPACDGMQLGECEALLNTDGPPLEVFDGWERPMIFLTHPDSADGLLISAGRDGGFEPDVGGPYLRSEPWRDLVYLLKGEGRGTWYQYPEGYQCGCQCPSTIREWVADARKGYAEADERADPIWQRHAGFVASGAATE